MKKLGILTLTLLLVASIFISGCASNNKGNETSALTELRFGFQPSTHQIAYMTAAEKGLWEKDLAPYGVKRITEKRFETGPPEMNAMSAGELDVAYVGAAPALAAISNQHLDAKIIAPAQINGSSIVLRLDENYASPKDLKGRTIATYQPGSIQDTLLRNWLKENGLDPEKDVKIKPMGGGEAVSAIEAKQVDAIFVPHPFPASVEKAGKGRTIVQSGQMEANHTCCVVLVSGKLIRDHPDVVEQIVKTHINATEYDKANIDEAAQIFSNKTNMSLEDVKASLNEWDGKWITDPLLIENSTVKFSSNLYEQNSTTRPLTKEDIFDISFYEKVVSGK